MVTGQDLTLPTDWFQSYQVRASLSVEQESAC